jgi:hypothetical protein
VDVLGGGFPGLSKLIRRPAIAELQPDRPALVDDLLNHPPDLPGVQGEVAGLVQAAERPVGQGADLVGQGMTRRPGVSRPR